MNHDALRAAIAPEWLPWLLAGALLVLVAALAEAVVLGRRGRYDWRAFAATLGDLVGRRAVDALGLSVVAPLLGWVHAHRLMTLTLDGPAAVLLLFIGQEFCYYWQHRASHRVRWWWATHCVHHSPNELTLASALRLGWTGKISGAAIFFAPLVWLGFHPLAVGAAVALNLLYQFWLHATWIPKLGPLEWLLNTPSHHRVHHARNPEYLDCNYGGVLIVFDRLFGSFVAERGDIAPAYGLVVPIRSYNPVHIALHGWFALVRDLRAARGWAQALATLFGPPERTPARSVPTPATFATRTSP
jgi:sterol desaturase/sphingolipid hydroxylase (fatty acid hydroxylase superfamily)